MSKIALVTGANQGLGLALVRGLCRSLGESAHVHLTARDPARGRAAKDALRAEGLRPSFEQLDVTSAVDIDRVARTLRERHGGIDVLISNAAARIVPGRSKGDQVREFVETNNLGTHRVLRAFVPILRDGGRLLIVASGFGRASLLPPAVRGHFVGDRSLEDIEATLADYVALVEAGRDVEAGWPEWINVPSKVAQVAAMRVVAASHRDEARRRDLLIAAVCPGLVDTDASRPWFPDMSAAQSPDEAAVDVLWLATLPRADDTLHGQLVQHRAVLPYLE